VGVVFGLHRLFFSNLWRIAKILFAI